MDIKATKLELMQLLLQEQKESVLEKIKEVFEKKEETSDWWDELTQEQKNSIDKGREELDSGLGIPHKEVMAKFKKWH